MKTVIIMVGKKLIIMTDYSKINWLIDTGVEETEYKTGFPKLGDAAEALGCKVYRTKYVPFSIDIDSNIPFDNEDCVIAHGCIPFIRQIQSKKNLWCPATYFNDNVKSFHKYATHISEYLLAQNWYLIPYGEFIRRKEYMNRPLFIKPNSGLKEFTGKVIDAYNFNETIQMMNAFEHVDPDLLCVVTRAMNIDAEFRYVIADKKVVTKSKYKWHDSLDVHVDTMLECDELAEKIASLEYQADLVYVCDISCQVHDGVAFDPRVIELNAFSSSGLYACDTNAIVKAVSDAAWKEYTGDLD